MSVNRRKLFQVAGAGAAAAAMPRFTFAQDSTPSASPGASPAVMATPQGTPDANGYYPSGTPGVPDAWTKVPEPFTSFDGKPGNGGPVTALVMTYGAPPTPMEDNAYWQGLNERLGVEWQPILTPNAQYGEKAATIIASGDMPDLFYLNYNQTTSPLAKFTQQGAFLDLTEYVTGDAVQEYPNLARFPDFMWNATKLDGKIYGVPCPSGRSGQVPAFRQDWADKLIGGTPTSSDEFHELFTQIVKSDPDGNGKADTWGMTSYSGDWDNGIIYPMFRAPNGWRVGDDGAFTSAYESDEYRMALEFIVQLATEKLYHPDTASMGFEDALNLFNSGRVSLHADGGGIYGEAGFQATIRQYQPDAVVTRLIPFGHDGGKGVTYNLPGIFGFTAIPSTITDEDRIHELLRIFDWFSSPFGSEEWLYKNYGEEGKHFEYNENGFPQTNDLWDKENGGLTGYIGGTQLYNITPDQPEIAPLLTDEANAIYALGIDDPSAGLFSPTAIEQSAEVGQVITDGIGDIATGRRSIDEWSSILDEWRNRGGDQIRKEYEEAYSKNEG